MNASTPTRATLVVGLLFAAGLLSGAWAGRTAAARAQDPYAGLDLFARVLTTIESDYVDPVDTDALIEAAIRGMVDELDEHSKWLTPEELREFRDETDGSYEGIGVEVRRVAAGMRVSNVLAGGPAQRDGVLPGDVIVAVDGVDLAGRSLEEVSRLLKGPRGTPVVLTLARGTETVEVRTVRDRVVSPAVIAERLPSGIGYVRLVQFQDEAAGTLLGHIEGLESEGPLSGLVLDMRDNPGGRLSEAVAVSDLFLDDGLIVSTRGRADGEEEYYATPGGVRPDLPVVVLVNGLSASASEIVAGALQDTGRATLVGTHTYGKGSVQVLYENRDHSALRLTTGRYYTPSGEPVAPAKGRTPDHVVELPPVDLPADELRERIAALDLPDEDREGLLDLVDDISILPPEVDPLVPWDGTLAERRARDPQLDVAIGLLEP